MFTDESPFKLYHVPNNKNDVVWPVWGSQEHTIPHAPQMKCSPINNKCASLCVCNSTHEFPCSTISMQCCSPIVQLEVLYVLDDIKDSWQCSFQQCIGRHREMCIRRQHSSTHNNLLNVAHRSTKILSSTQHASGRLLLHMQMCFN